MAHQLSREKALIFRITHIDNVEWVLDHGMHCANSKTKDPGFVAIGKSDLIQARASREIDVGPCGTLKDYVPFYFTPYSPMMYNIKTGYGVVKKQANDDIVVFVSSLPSLADHHVPFVFSDRHAFLETAEFFSEMDHLDRIDWKVIQARDFRRDPEDPEKIDRYQAEALAFRHVPIEAMLGLVCYNQTARARIQPLIDARTMALDLRVQPGWYF